MALIIKHRKVVTDSWQLLKSQTEGGALSIPGSGDIIVPLAVWLNQRNLLLSRPGRLGVWLNGCDEPTVIVDDLSNFGVIAVNFAQFADGRGYSLARLLRERHGWRGELRAVGDVLRDQLFYLSRCGFDAFDLRADQDLHAALASFDDFSGGYQAAVGRALPLFRRRFTTSPDGIEWL